MLYAVVTTRRAHRRSGLADNSALALHHRIYAVRCWLGRVVATPHAPRAAQAATTSSTLNYLPLIRQSSAPSSCSGWGPTASSASAAALASRAPLGLLTTWYNGPTDLTWMTFWKTGTIPQSYAAGYALHLIVFVGGAESTVDTSYGAVCGRPYPLSPSIVGRASLSKYVTPFRLTRSCAPLYNPPTPDTSPELQRRVAAAKAEWR